MPVRGLQVSAPPSVRVGTSAWLEAAGGCPAIPAGVSCVSGSGAARWAAVKVGSVPRVSAEALMGLECRLSGPMVDAPSQAPRRGSDGESLPEALLEIQADSCNKRGFWTRETRERDWRGAGPRGRKALTQLSWAPRGRAPSPGRGWGLTSGCRRGCPLPGLGPGSGLGAGSAMALDLSGMHCGTPDGKVPGGL